MEQHKSTTHQEKYMHIRDVDHPRIKAITVFARQHKDTWLLSFAYCSVHDNFERRVGRQVARRRFFNEGPEGVIFGDFDYEQATNHAVKWISAHVQEKQ